MSRTQSPIESSVDRPRAVERIEAVVVSSTAKIGGAETSLLEFLRRVPPDERSRYGIALPDAEGPLRTRVTELGYPTIDVPLPDNELPLPETLTFLEAVRTLSRVLRTAPVETVYSNQLTTGPILTALKLRHPGVRTVVHVRDHRRPIGVLYRQINLQDEIVFNSQFVRDEAIGNRFMRHLVRGREHVVYNCVDVELGRQRARQPADVDPVSGVTVGMFGRFMSWKRFDYALEQICRSDLYDRIDRILLVGARSGLGEPDYERRIAALADSLDPADKVDLVPFQENVWPYYDACDVVVVPSENEPFGRVPIEAGALGVPVVVANSGGLRELVTHGETGYLFEHSNPGGFRADLGRLVDDPALRERFGEALRRDVETRFSPEEYYSAIARIVS